MNTLHTDTRLDDDFYEALIETHKGLSPQQSHALNARLVLLLANHVGDIHVLRKALAAARESDNNDDSNADDPAEATP